MENASKALLIAGAILIAILLIALGMLVYTAGKAQVEKSGAQLDSDQMQAFNSRFTYYEGRKSGSEVISLINDIQINAVSPNSENPNLKFNGTPGTSTITLNMYKKSIRINDYYELKCVFDEGYIDDIELYDTNGRQLFVNNTGLYHN